MHRALLCKAQEAEQQWDFKTKNSAFLYGGALFFFSCIFIDILNIYRCRLLERRT